MIGQTILTYRGHRELDSLTASIEDITDTVGEVEYVCPVCQETLFYDEESARRFLRGVEDEDMFMSKVDYLGKVEDKGLRP